MALNAAALIVEKQAFIAAFPFISIHTAGAVSSSASESTAARLNAGWTVNGTTGVASITAPKNFTGGGNGTAAVRVGYWSAATGGNYGGGYLLSGDATFNSAGEYGVTAGTETPSAT